MSTAEQEVLWDIAIKQAINAAKNAGKETGGFEELVKANEARVNWREQLSRFLNAHAKTDYSWHKTNPVFRNFVIPTMHKESIGHLTFAIDTSGSVHSEWLSQFIGELNFILERLDFEGITIMLLLS